MEFLEKPREESEREKQEIHQGFQKGIHQLAYGFLSDPSHLGDEMKNEEQETNSDQEMQDLLRER